MRNTVYQLLSAIVPTSCKVQQLSEEAGDFMERLGASQAWFDGKMSNFDYLTLVNLVGGRSFQDITQYPVFPWLFNNYKTGDYDTK